MTLAELIQSTPEAEILAECSRLDPENDEAAYQNMLANLKAIEPCLTRMTILIEPWEDYEFHLVHGLFPGSEETQAIDFIAWGEWLAAEIRIKNLDLTPAQIIAQCLFEMSFISFDPERIEEEREMLVKMANEIRDTQPYETENDV